MESFFLVLVMLEMLCVNMYTFHICSEKRYSLFAIIVSIGIFTMLLFGVSYFFLKDTNIFGKGLFMVCGIVYLVPLTLLYRQSAKYSVSIMCSSWIYTMLIYALSVQFADLIPQWNHQTALLVIQTALYALTILPFFRLISGKFLYIIKNADQKTKKLLFLLGIFWFLFVALLYYTLVFDMHSSLAKIARILVLCVSAVNAFMTYQIFYSFRRENQNALGFESALRLDALTGLKNRIAFFEETQALIDSHIPFTIFFIDLDDFKSINDNYGHMKGDLYLKQFSDSFSAGFSSFGTVYRISGDEFVFLHIHEKQDRSVHDKIDNFTMPDCDGIPFKGFSMGSASYMEDAQTLNQLIVVADKRMYEKKKIES